MLYQIHKNLKLEPINKKKILEKDIQNLIENNLTCIFGVKLVQSEFSIENVRFDTLAFDIENNAPVIIEFKKSFEKSLFDQWLEYLNILFSRKADFSIALHKKIWISPDPDNISWENARIIFVSGNYSERQKRAVSFQGLPIELWRFEWMENNFLELEKEKLNKETSLSEATKTIKNNNAPIKKVQQEIQEYSREYYKNKTTEEIWEFFEKIENNVMDWENIEIRYHKLYICFYSKKSFFVIKLLKTKLQLEFGKEKDASVFKNIEGVQDISSRWWNHTFLFEITDEKQIEAALFVLKKALENL